MHPTIGSLNGDYCPQPLKSFDYSMFDNIDKSFSAGPGPVNSLGPTSPMPQNFMAHQCSINWSPYCEKYYNFHSRKCGSHERMFPNTIIMGRPPKCNMNLGKTLLRNAAIRRYIDLKSVPCRLDPLNPVDYSSPLVPVFSAFRSFDRMPLTAEAESFDIDQDVIMQHMLEDPEPVMDILEHLFANLSNDRTRTYRTLYEMFTGNRT